MFVDTNKSLNEIKIDIYIVKLNITKIFANNQKKLPENCSFFRVVYKEIENNFFFSKFMGLDTILVPYLIKLVAFSIIFN